MNELFLALKAMTNNNFIVYRSSAGSGKTYTLVKEYLGIVLSKKSESYYRHILAITFTNKAAAEMKERVIGRLRQLAQGPEANDFDEYFSFSLAKDIGIDEKELHQRASKCIKHILHNYSELSISTIDSFVHRLIRSFSKELRLNPDFEVEIDSTIVLEESVERILEKTGIDLSLSQVLINFSLSKIEDDKHWDIKEDILDYGKNILKEDSLQWLERLSTLTIDDFKAIRKKMAKVITEFEDDLTNVAENSLDLIKSNGIEDSDFSGSYIPKYFQKILQLDFSSPNATVRKQMAGDTAMYPKKTSEGAKAAIDGIANALQSYFEQIQELLDSDSFKVYNTIKDAQSALYSIALLNEIKKETELLKEEKNIILISDFNRIIGKVVMNNPSPFIYEKIGERYNHFLIDEFQDTSISQWQNFLPLLENALSKNYKNLIVGDGKQAIYRWRNGEVQQFNQLPKIYGQDGNPYLKDTEAVLTRSFQKMNLEYNYRSSLDVVEFNNKLFGELKKHLGDYQSIYDGWEQKAYKKKSGFVSIDKSIAKLKEDRSAINFDIIKTRIDESLEDGYGQEDISILVRGNEEGIEIASFLLNNNYNVISSESLLLKNSPIVSALVNTLGFLANDNDEGAKLNLISALYSCELLSGDLNEAYLKYSQIVERKGVVMVEQLLDDYFGIKSIDKLRSKGLYEICEYLIDAFGFHERADIFLEFFLNAVAKFEEKENSHIKAFIHWWGDKKDDLSIGMTESHAGIRIMTIHKSKGLQFPVVIYPIKYSTNSKASKLWIENGLPQVDLPAALLTYRASKAETHIQDYEEEFKKQHLDNMNVVYVALTRAEDRLHIVLESIKPYSPPSELKHLHEYMESSLAKAFEDYSHEEIQYSRGSRSLKTEKNILPESIVLNRYYTGSFQNNLSIAFRASRFWGEMDEDGDSKDNKAASFGILVHRLLSMIDTEDELESALGQLKRTANIGMEEIDAASILVKNLVRNEEIKKWFTPGLKIKNEAAIIKESGKSIRPDRIVYFEDHIDVIDYKTGIEREEHHKQIMEYQAQISELEDLPVKAHLIYTDNLKVTAVN